MRIARRRFLLGTGAALIAPRLGLAGVETLIDSPALAEKVAAGTLPALAERLPKTPRLVDVLHGLREMNLSHRVAQRQNFP